MAPRTTMAVSGARVRSVPASGHGLLDRWRRAIVICRSCPAFAASRPRRRRRRSKRGVDGDPVQPGRRTTRAPRSGPGAPHLDHRLLHRVLRLVDVAEHAHREREHPGARRHIVQGVRSPRRAAAIDVRRERRSGWGAFRTDEDRLSVWGVLAWWSWTACAIGAHRSPPRRGSATVGARLCGQATGFSAGLTSCGRPWPASDADSPASSPPVRRGSCCGTDLTAAGCGAALLAAVWRCSGLAAAALGPASSGPRSRSSALGTGRVAILALGSSGRRPTRSASDRTATAPGGRAGAGAGQRPALRDRARRASPRDPARRRRVRALVQAFQTSRARSRPSMPRQLVSAAAGHVRVAAAAFVAGRGGCRGAGRRRRSRTGCAR